MDELRRHAAPLIERWQRLNRSQRLGVAIMLVVGAVGFFFFLGRRDDEWQLIAGGREFTKAERSAIQSAWRKLGLKSSRVDGNTLAAPKSEFAQYEAALPKLSSDESSAGSEWEKQLSRANLFTSHEQFEQLKENALRVELRRTLSAIPNIASADVIWARSKVRLGLAARSKVTATITVAPRDGYDITPDLAESLRTAVASMIPDLSSDDIVVLDQSTGVAITETSSSLIAEQQRRRQQERFAQQLESKVGETFAQIPGTIVRVRPTSNRSEADRRQTILPAASIIEQPMNRQHVTAKPSIQTASVNWQSDVPHDFVDFTTLLTNGAETVADHTAAERDDSEQCRVEIQIPKTYFDAQFARQCLANWRGSAQNDFDSISFENVVDAEVARLRESVEKVLLPHRTSIDLSVASQADAAAPQSEPPFAAWPHAICALVGILCVVSANWRSSRKRSPNQTLSGSANVPPCDELLLSRTNDPQPHVTLATPQEISSPIPLSPAIVEVSDLVRLRQLHSQQLAEVLRSERPQAIAVLLTRLPTRLASECLSRLNSSLQTEVIRRLKSLGDVSDEVVNEIARAVCSRLSDSSNEPAFEPGNRIGHLLPDPAKARAFA